MKSKATKLKYKVRRNSAGKWCVWASKTAFYAVGGNKGEFDAEADAIAESLYREGGELVEKLDDVQARLEARGLIDERDPHGWRA